MKSLSSSKNEAIIGTNMTIKGHISGESSLTILGNVEGEISITERLTIGEDAQIDANISSKELISSGKISGDIESSMVTLTSDAELSGDITTEKISFEEGVRFNGMINMDFELPDGI